MNETGEYIPLRWEGDPDYEVVRGHVKDWEFALAVGGYYGEYGRVPEVSVPVHRWARWSFNGCDEYGNPSRVLRIHGEPGRGRFSVTVADVTGWREIERCLLLGSHAGGCRHADGHVDACEPWPDLLSPSPSETP